MNVNSTVPQVENRVADANPSMPKAEYVPVDALKLQQMAEVVERRDSAMVVIPGKGTVLMTKTKEGNYQIMIQGDDDRLGSFTTNSRGEILKVGEIDIKEIGQYNLPKLEMLNEYLTALPVEQISLKEIPRGSVPDFKPGNDDALVKGLENGFFDKNKLMVAIWAATGGTQTQLGQIVEGLKDLSPYALTPQFIESVRGDLLAEVAAIKGDPDGQVKSTREALRTALKLSDSPLSGDMTKMYQESTGDYSTTVVVSSSVNVDDSMAIQIGDGNVLLSKRFCDFVMQKYPEAADQKKIILDILKHEREHYINGDSASRQLLYAAQAEFIRKTEQGLKDGSIPKDEAISRLVAAELLEKAEVRKQERRADGEDGLEPETVAALEAFTKQQLAAAAATAQKEGAETRKVNPELGSVWSTHPPTSER